MGVLQVTFIDLCGTNAIYIIKIYFSSRLLDYLFATTLVPFFLLLCPLCDQKCTWVRLCGLPFLLHPFQSFTCLQYTMKRFKNWKYLFHNLNTFNTYTHFTWPVLFESGVGRSLYLSHFPSLLCNKKLKI